MDNGESETVEEAWRSLVVVGHSMRRVSSLEAAIHLEDYTTKSYIY